MTVALPVQSPADAFQSSKRYDNYPCSHRQHRHDGNCALVHGYSRSFYFLFEAHTLDECGFVVDFGKLKWIKQYLDYLFDHTLLLCEDDPLLPKFRQLEEAGAAAIRLMPYGVGMEGTAQHLCEYVDARLREETKGRCWVSMVESRENDKNSAWYHNPERGFKGWL
jgi:6-pyruvoyltetrahydropterin/6-carboxytetrahydropterin synthase